ncbi:hypothetical protein WMF04_17210 [Sorangium sp. So ce260]|uniref:hypothetical protein n=1 Tax=Sorangium sp. So ce260 TaxID=3133291 RepID=UPI003F637542
MNTEAALGHAMARIDAGAARDAVIGELVQMGSSPEAAQAVVDQSVATKRAAQDGDLALSLLRQGQSPAEVWEVLVSSGAEPAAAEALVRELVKLRPAAGAVHHGAPAGVRAQAATSGDHLWMAQDAGSFWKGFFAGFLCGCWAIIVYALSSDTLGGETKRGMRTGIGLNLCLSVGLQVITEISRAP